MPKSSDRTHFDEITSRIRLIGRVEPPEGGWIQSARKALGLTLADVAKRLKVTPPAVRSFEQAEAEDRITLGSLRRVAAAMDCELIHAFVPRRDAPTPPAGSVPDADVASEKVTDLTWNAQREM
jgi:predicted DNA-binding mobile mystery protein A